jgi:hypothetical protein
LAFLAKNVHPRGRHCFATSSTLEKDVTIIKAQKPQLGTSFTAFIHTIEIGTKASPVPVDTLAKRPYMSKAPFIRSEKIHYVINPNKFKGSGKITRLQEFFDVFELILQDMCLTHDEWELLRLDLAIDTYSNFDTLFKINCYLKELYAYKIGAHNSFRTIGDNLQKRSSLVRKNEHELEIYNKQIESLDSSLPQTRIEFRRKRLNRSYTKSDYRTRIKKTIQHITSDLLSLPNLINQFDDVKRRELFDSFNIESSPEREGRVKNLSDFTMKFSEYIYSRNSLLYLYCKTNQKNSIENFTWWLCYLKKSKTNIQLISENDMRRYCKGICNAIEKYVKS